MNNVNLHTWMENSGQGALAGWTEGMTRLDSCWYSSECDLSLMLLECFCSSFIDLSLFPLKDSTHVRLQ